MKETCLLPVLLSTRESAATLGKGHRTNFSKCTDCQAFPHTSWAPARDLSRTGNNPPPPSSPETDLVCFPESVYTRKRKNFYIYERRGVQMWDWDDGPTTAAGTLHSLHSTGGHIWFPSIPSRSPQPLLSWLIVSRKQCCSPTYTDQCSQELRKANLQPYVIIALLYVHSWRVF